MHLTSLSFIYATSRSTIYLHRVTQRSWSDCRERRNWLIPVLAMSKACCGRAFQFTSVRRTKLVEFINVSTGMKRDVMYCMHVSSFPDRSYEGI